MTATQWFTTGAAQYHLHFQAPDGNWYGVPGLWACRPRELTEADTAKVNEALEQFARYGAHAMGMGYSEGRRDKWQQRITSSAAARKTR